MVRAARRPAGGQIPALLADHPRVPHHGRQHVRGRDTSRVHRARSALRASRGRHRGPRQPQADHAVVQHRPRRRGGADPYRFDRPGREGRLLTPDRHHPDLLRGGSAVRSRRGGRDPDDPAAGGADHRELHGAPDDGSHAGRRRRARAGRVEDRSLRALLVRGRSSRDSGHVDLRVRGTEARTQA